MARRGTPWWAVAAAVAIVGASVAIALLATDGGGPTSTVAATTSATVSSSTIPASTLPDTTHAATTSVPITSTTTSSSSTTTTSTTAAAGGSYDRETLAYFREVAGGAEFGGGGGTIHRWEQDLRIGVYGSPTDRDRRALAAVVDDLNQILDPIQVRVVEAGPNVELHFVPVEEFPTLEPNYVEGNLGYVWVWWDEAGAIYRARVLISTTGLTPAERAHLIREELTQGLGLLNDSWAYPESIFYAGWTSTRNYLPIDRRLIEMLYRPELAPGMDIEAALAVLAAVGG